MEAVSQQLYAINLQEEEKKEAQYSSAVPSD